MDLGENGSFSGSRSRCLSSIALDASNLATGDYDRSKLLSETIYGKGIKAAVIINVVAHLKTRNKSCSTIHDFAERGGSWNPAGKSA